MLGLEWGGCGKIFSSIYWRLTEIWTQQESKIAHFVCKISLWALIQYIDNFFVRKSISRWGAVRLLFSKLLSIKRRKSWQVHSLEKLSKNGALVIKMLFNIIITKVHSKNRSSQHQQFFTLFQTKKNIWLYIELWSNAAGDASSNPPSEKNTKQVFEMPGVSKNAVFCEYLCTDKW